MSTSGPAVGISGAPRRASGTARRTGAGGVNGASTVSRLGTQPPAIAPSTMKGSRPSAIASGSVASGSKDQSSSQA